MASAEFSKFAGILSAALSQHHDVQAAFRKGRGTRDQIANIRWIMEKAREFQKNIYFCFIDYAKAFDCVDHNKLWKILTESRVDVVWGRPRCVWARESTAPAQGNQSLTEEPGGVWST